MMQTEVEYVCSCPICRKAKKVRQTYKVRSENTKANKPGEDMCMDIGEFRSPFFGRSNYLFVIIDEYSKFMVVFPIVNKSLAAQEIINPVTLADNCFELRITTLHSDGEFNSKPLKEFCAIRGIRLEFTTTKTPEQNSEVERANRTLAEGIRAMLLGSGMAEGYWAEVAKTFTYVSNLTP